MARRDERPQPSARSWTVGVGVVPYFWDSNRRSRGCGYLFTRVRCVGVETSCASGLTHAEDLAAHMLPMLPTDYALAVKRAWSPDDPFEPCGHDIDCQNGYFPVIRGHAPLQDSRHDSFMVWSISGFYYDPTGAERAGFTRVVVPVSWAYPALPGQHRYPVDRFPQWRTFVDYLAGSPFLFADRYGRKCKPASYVTLHWSSFYQK